MLFRIKGNRAIYPQQTLGLSNCRLRKAPLLPSCLLPSVVFRMRRETRNGNPSPEKEKPGKIPGEKLKLPFSLSREGRSTSASAGRVRIFECETRTHHVRCVIDGDPVQVLGREHIDEKLDAVFLNYEIA